MYTLNKVSTLLPLVLITSYCVGTCFLHAQGKHLQAATRNATAGRPPGNGTTPSSPLAATKKLGGALWAPYDRGAYTPLHTTSTARDTQYYATSPEPVLSAVFTVTIMYTCIP
jgi:hypothetical protein